MHQYQGPSARAGSPPHPSRRASLALLFAMTVLPCAPWASAAPIYRWLSPAGVPSYGDTPPADARHITVVGEETPSPPSPPPSPPASGPAAPESPPSGPSPSLTQEAIISRLNLLTAIQNYENSLVPRTHPPHSVYAPAFLWPYGGGPGFAQRPMPPAPPPGPPGPRPQAPIWAKPPPQAGPGAPQSPFWASPPPLGPR
ncbi:DUF4124 domain-containing protein [Acidithiobacillus sp.]|uniref:DUF4124 domain-containing protein n=2 Tax=Acidithiobacillus sp. TaxID=1872118 RepID=UPI003D009FF1